MKKEKILYPIVAFLLTATVWEILVRIGIIKSLFLPAPSSIVVSLTQNLWYLFSSTLITIKHIFIGYAIGVSLAITLGIFTGRFKQIDLSLAPLLLVLSPIPIVTFVPLFILWFGLGVLPIILCAIIASFFPTFLNTVSGVKKTDHEYIEVAKNFGGSEKKILTKVILPASLPHITNGLRASIQLTFLVTPVAEMIMGDIGLGGLIWKSADLFRTELVLLGQLTLGFMGLSLFKFFDFIEKNYILRWMKIGA